MKILSMTATFGKLSHQTLTLQPGLNVIHAPNEWGKSTWCAFIVAMLYGIDTKERTTAAALADKERYAPWSGEPMSGRMDICWCGRNITLERSSKGRVPFGEFRAYETESGLPVPELTAGNCGQVLLGVEKSVFTKSGFIRLTDMPVVQDEALRRRLNALVTTGDESGTGDVLAQRLRDLRNKCRHNKTGLLPQAEAQRDELKRKLEQHTLLQSQLERIHAAQHELDAQLKALENHRQALEHAAAKEGLDRLTQAQIALLDAQAKYRQCDARCQMLPSEEYAAQQLQQLRTLQTQQTALDAEVLPVPPVQPETPAIFKETTPTNALQSAKEDKARFDRLSRPLSPIGPILAALFAAAGIGLLFVRWYLVIPGLLLSAATLLVYLRIKKKRFCEREAIAVPYGDLSPEQWVSAAQRYCDQLLRFSEAEAAAKAVADSLESRRQALRSSIHALTQGLSIEDAIQKWESVVLEHRSLAAAQQAMQQADDRVSDLSAAIKTVDAPAFTDALTLSAEETSRAIQTTAAELHRLQLQAGQYMGQKETLGAEAALTQQLTAVHARIQRLEDTYSALTVALDTLTNATNALQRRFAPRIASRAQSLFGQLTGGRYDRLQLTQDLSLNAAAVGEDALQPSRWRSDGTVDQLYLALRLAVAAELTPEAPLVLDDALVRFDDTRAAAAMEILREEAASKQVILFTCQKRETTYSPDKNINI